MTRNSSSSVMLCAITSGNAVTICCSGESSALFLNSKSPIARESARLPFTRPKSTNPPAAHIRAFSPKLRFSERKTYISRAAYPRSEVCDHMKVVLLGL